jgi:hypothetical protein
VTLCFTFQCLDKKWLRRCYNEFQYWFIPLVAPRPSVKCKYRSLGQCFFLTYPSTRWHSFFKILLDSVDREVTYNWAQFCYELHQIFAFNKR